MNKGKTPGELIRASPALLVYYHVRLAGFMVRRWQLRLGGRGVDRIDRSRLGEGLPDPPEREA